MYYCKLGGECIAKQYHLSIHDYYYNYKTGKVYLKKGLKHRLIPSTETSALLMTLDNYNMLDTLFIEQIPKEIIQVKIDKRSIRKTNKSKNYLHYKQNELLNKILGQSLQEEFVIPNF